LCEEKVQSLREVVEEAIKVPPYKSKKKMKGKDKFGLSKI
jgi:hypothetical protein